MQEYIVTTLEELFDGLQVMFYAGKSSAVVEVAAVENETVEVKIIEVVEDGGDDLAEGQIVVISKDELEKCLCWFPSGEWYLRKAKGLGDADLTKIGVGLKLQAMLFDLRVEAQSMVMSWIWQARQITKAWA